MQYLMLCAGLLLTVFLLYYSSSSPRHVSFISCILIAGSFFGSQLTPYFDPEMKLFGVMAVLLIGIGALIGGVLGVLVPKISTGASLGFLLALFISLVIISVDHEVTADDLTLSSVLFPVLIVIAIALVQKTEAISSQVRTAWAAGLAFTLSVDNALSCAGVTLSGGSRVVAGGDGGLLSVIKIVLSSRMPSDAGSAQQPCIRECFVGPLLVLWAAFSTISLIVQLFRSGLMRDLYQHCCIPANSSSSSDEHAALLSSDGAGPGVGRGVAAAAGAGVKSSNAYSRQRTFSYPDTLVFNYFDPDNIPEQMQAYADAIFDIVQKLGKLYGFQVDNCRNQSEHLLMMLSNETQESDKYISGPASRLHLKMFTNYRKWCARMNVTPILMRDLYVKKSYEHLIEDLIVYLLIWGEAANLRHMPECICFLFHKTMAEHRGLLESQGVLPPRFNGSVAATGGPRPDSQSKTGSSRFAGATLYPGFYLDMVVQPVYDVLMDAANKKGGDHVARKHYDDFNEFFWSPACLQFCIFHHDAGEQVTDALEGGHGVGPSRSVEEPTLASGLRNASKTYLEKRSWLHPLISINRIFEWHAVTFTVLLAWAFACQLQWTYAFSIQVGSFVFWEITFFSLLWTCLEIWTMYPDVRVSEPSMYGFLVRLLAGFLILTYQTIYFHWSFVTDKNTSLREIELFNRGDGNFWWWQYLWLSLIACSLYLLQSILCWFPSVISGLMTMNNDLLQAFLSICYPLSQLYVGKRVHVGQYKVFQYIFFWLTLIAFKFWFGYRYIVFPVSVPSLLLYDDYMNFQNISFLKTSSLIFFWWFPHYLVYMIDLSIWYSVWSGTVGGFIALIERQGAVRDGRNFRGHFMRAPLAFCQRLMPYNSAVNQRTNSAGNASTTSLTNLMMAANDPTTELSSHDYRKIGNGKNGKNLSRSPPPASSYQNSVGIGNSVVMKPQAIRGSKSKSSADLAGMGSSHNHTLDISRFMQFQQQQQQQQGAPLGGGSGAVAAGGIAGLGGRRFAPAVSSINDVEREREMRDEEDWFGAGRTERTMSITATKMTDENNLVTQISQTTDVRSQRWVIFANMWNEVIHRLRETDHISNKERDLFLFTYFEWLSKPVYLPLYQTAGCVSVAAVAFQDACSAYTIEVENSKKMAVLEAFNSALSAEAKEAMSEVGELVSWLLSKLLGVHHQKDFDRVSAVLGRWAASNDIFARASGGGGESMTKLLQHTSSVVQALRGAISKRQKNPVVTAEFLLRRQEAAAAVADKGGFLHHTAAASGTGAGSNNSNNNNHNGGGGAGAKESARGFGGRAGGGGGGTFKKSVSTGFLAALNEQQALDDAASPRAPIAAPGASPAATTNAEGAGIAAARATADKTKGAPTSANKYAKMQPFRKQHLLVDLVRDKVRDQLRGFFSTLRSALKVSGITAEGQDLSDRLTFLLSLENGFFWNDVYASGLIDQIAQDDRTPRVLTKLEGLLNLRVTQVELRSPEARRRLNFFLNSLFMDMPSVPSTRFTKEYSCITPYYSEDIILSKKDLEAKNNSGVSTLLYLQTLYKGDWLNFLERKGITDDQTIWSSKRNVMDTRCWASLRAQTLYRTVEGMMYTEAAVRLMSELETLSSEEVDLMAKLKFNYVVACQVYGVMKKNLDSKADDIEFLLQQYPNLRVAYIDSVQVARAETAYYSVLIKHDTNAPTSDSLDVKEVFRVKLPGNPVLGEGKPENQNHALIFSRGRYLQAIDMNQEGYFEEALKMRNLLQEFDSGCAILGFKEHIYTGSVSSVANYMALQELSFVTLGQRVLSNPLCIRQHYGHPDLFDKMFVMTEGGMSKASKGINLSEDVFAGFNATIRGHTVGFKEYAQVGKGRDVGLQQTYKFEAKLSQGNAEQSLTRDLSRICGRLDFFRLMSFYYGGIGHYLSNTLVMFTLVIVVYTMLAFAVYGEEGVNGRAADPLGLLQQLLAGMGILQTMPLVVTLTVEKGFLQAMSELGYMFLSGGPFYFIFHIQTKSYYFSHTLMAGGAKYRPTGRGFVTTHSPFDENFRFFAMSHIYLGFELMVALVLFGLHTTSKQYGGLTWSLWMTVIAFMLGPFWFNPLSFEWDKIADDYKSWMGWMTERGGTAEQSWEAWWRDENAFYGQLSSSWKVFLAVQKCFLWVFLAVGLAGSKFMTSPLEEQKVLEVAAIFAAFLLGNWQLNGVEKSLSYAVRRFLSLALNLAVVVIAAVLFCVHVKYVRYTVASYYLLSAVAFLFLLTGLQNHVIALYKLHDFIVGHVIFILLGVLAVLQLGYFQTWLLYHNALSAGVEMDDILKYARKTKQRDTGEINAVAQLRMQVSQQDETIKRLLLQQQQQHPHQQQQNQQQQQQQGGYSYGNGMAAVEYNERSPLTFSSLNQRSILRPSSNSSSSTSGNASRSSTTTNTSNAAAGASNFSAASSAWKERERSPQRGGSTGTNTGTVAAGPIGASPGRGYGATGYADPFFTAPTGAPAGAAASNSGTTQPRKGKSSNLPPSSSVALPPSASINNNNSGTGGAHGVTWAKLGSESAGAGGGGGGNRPGLHTPGSISGNSSRANSESGVPHWGIVHPEELNPDGDGDGEEKPFVFSQPAHFPSRK